MTEATQGQQGANSGASDFNALSFVVQQMISRVNVATLVKVMACSNAGGVSPVGTVDVQILVNQVDGAGKPVPHVTVYGLPYLRLQGGANAIIMDPQAGDIGVAVFAQSDISAVKQNKAQANPGSGRRNSIADGMYFGGMINAVPTQYVQFNATGIALVSPTKISLTAPELDVTVTTLNMQASGTAVLNCPSTAISGGGTSIDGKAFLPHHHGGVTVGAGQTSGVS